MQKLAVGDTAGFAHLAHDTAGVFAAWSVKVESHAPAASDSGSSYDTAQGRLERATALRDSGMNDEAVHAYGCADLGQAKPATAAVTEQPQTHAKKQRPGTGHAMKKSHRPTLE